jgi:hypothetical protein
MMALEGWGLLGRDWALAVERAAIYEPKKVWSALASGLRSLRFLRC